MIRKLSEIKNVGRLEDYTASGDVQFKKLTMIYAQNGRGKTTLVDIFRSLSEDEGSYILGRKTLGQDQEPYVKVRLEGGDAIFEDGTWNKPPQDIEIFDEFFVRENIHSGDVIDHEHKKNLHSLIIGEAAGKLADKIAQYDEVSRKIQSSQRETENVLRPKIVDGLSREEFLKLTEVEDLEVKTKAKEDEVSALEQQGKIKESAELKKITLPEPPKGQETLLAKKLPDLTAEVEAKVKEKIRQLGGDDPETWLSNGVSYQKDDKCPFCDTDTTNIEIVKSYSAYFDDAYRELKESVKDALAELKLWGNEETLLKLQKDLNKNEGLVDFWKQFIKFDADSIKFSEINTAISELKVALREVLSKKKSSPLEAIGLGTKVEPARLQFDTVFEKVEKYNKFVETTNQSIQAKKKTTEAGDVKAVTLELTKLKNTPERFKPKISELCEQYLVNQKALPVIQDKKKYYQDKLEEQTELIFDKYLDSINAHLKNFSAGFRITELTSSNLGGKPNSSYHLVINNTPVRLGGENTPKSEPSFKNTVSSGDKSALAFAFFLAKLETQPGLENKVIVLDDPISSQDRFRLNYTQTQICNLMNQAKQVIVLSHDANFLWQLFDRIYKSKSAVSQLEVRGIGDGSKSVIATWDVVNATSGDYSQNHADLTNFMKNGRNGSTLFHILRCIRPTLESCFRRKFPNKLNTLTLGEMIREIRKTDDSELLKAKPYLNKLIDINVYSRKYHHGLPSAAGPSEPIEESELRIYAEKALDMTEINFN